MESISAPSSRWCSLVGPLMMMDEKSASVVQVNADLYPTMTGILSDPGVTCR
jgi:hypothetical protein